MSTVFFTSNEGVKVKELVLLAQQTGERQNMFVTVEATSDGESVATFQMEISVKIK
jgi:hypothetical protein